MPHTLSTELPVVEMFSTLQGEGPWIGTRQVFLRLARCNLDCIYCDTPTSEPDLCRIEQIESEGGLLTLPNPVSVETVSGIIQRWLERAPGAHHSLSLTGGEPLTHDQALAEWLPRLRQLLPVYLETNGTLPEAIPSLRPHLDFISMDLKLPSVAQVEPLWEVHQRFLQAIQTVPGYIKIVVSAEVDREELVTAAHLVAQYAPEKILVLQPLTFEGQPSVAADDLIAYQGLLSRYHGNVRVIPQVHPLLGVL